MKKSFDEPKGFGQVLDHTFFLVKTKFKELIKIFLILIVPIILLEAILEFSAGMSLIRDTGGGSTWFDRAMSSLDEDGATTSYAAGGWLLLTGALMLLLMPVAQGAVLFAVNAVRQGKDFTAGEVIKKAFSRFWAMLGANIIFAILLVLMLVVPIMMVSTIAIGATGFGAVIVLIFGLFGVFLGVGLLATRFSFYFAYTVLEKKTPGIGHSWTLSQDRTWKTFGLYVVLGLIVMIATFAVEGTFAALLGNSVLLMIINQFVLIFTYLIFTVGYAVIFFDLKTRYFGSDLRDMLDEYKDEQERV